MKEYELRRVIIGHIDTDGPGEVSIWVDINGNIVTGMSNLYGIKNSRFRLCIYLPR